MNKGFWRIPDHQRSTAWTNEKQDRWARDVVDIFKVHKGGSLPGCIITYTLKGDPDNVTYLNDGAQRAHWSMPRIKECCEREGYSPSDVLENVTITVQDLEYESVDKAIDHFLKLNCGTSATVYELGRTVLVSKVPDWKNFWQGKMDQVSHCVNAFLVRLGCSKIPDRNNPKHRESAHSHLRHDYWMFWKFVTCDKSKAKSSATTKYITSETFDKVTAIESNLADLIVQSSSAEIDEAIDKFRSHLDRNGSFLKQLWREAITENPRVIPVPSVTWARWWLLVSICIKNNDYSHDAFREFTKRVIVQGNGTSELRSIHEGDEGRGGNNMTISSPDIGSFLRCVNMRLEDLEKPKRKQQPSLPPGYVHSHVKSFAEFGEGETLIENAVDNARRCNRDMTTEEEIRLRSLQTC